MQDVPGLAEVLAPDGWANASSASQGEGDPGRYNCLFGRDSLITALAVLPARPDVAAATLRALAAIQGTREDVTWDEEPGKIVHEVRPGISVARQGYLGLEVPDGELRYYGSADATPLFLHVLATTGDGALAAELERNWRARRRLAAGRAGARRRPAALAPARRPAASSSRAGATRTTRSARRRRAAGSCTRTARAPEPPVADADTQAAALAGLRGLAKLSGDRAHADAAEALAARIGARVGPRDDGARRRTTGPCAGPARSSAGCCGPGRPVAGAAERLSEPDVLTGYGLRTLSDRHPQFDPQSYHRGSVWPFDSWLGWGGLRAAGHAEAAERVRQGVLAGVERIGHYPELYAVTDAGPEVATLSNFVQAWTVGAVWALRNEWDGGAHVVA